MAASFAAVGWGSDTCGSIRIPAAVHNLFGLRPTKGLSSIDGILPLSHSQDTGGPLARTVTDLAIALDATVGPDAADPATAVLEGRPTPDFQAALDPAALEGARIGVLADWLEEDGGGGRITEVVRAALAEMDSLGAEVVDVTIPDLDSLLANTGLIDLEFKFDLMDYLAGVPDAPVATLEEIVEAGLHHEALDANFRRRIARTERPTDEYEETMVRRGALRDAVLGFMDAEALDALAYPTMRQRDRAHRGGPGGLHLLAEREHRAAGAHRARRVHRDGGAGGARAARPRARRRPPGRLRLRARDGQPQAAGTAPDAAARKGTPAGSRAGRARPAAGERGREPPGGGDLPAGSADRHAVLPPHAGGRSSRRTRWGWSCGGSRRPMGRGAGWWCSAWPGRTSPRSPARFRSPRASCTTF